MNFEAEKNCNSIGDYWTCERFQNQSDIVMFSTIEVNTCYRNR